MLNWLKQGWDCGQSWDSMCFICPIISVGIPSLKSVGTAKLCPKGESGCCNSQCRLGDTECNTACFTRAITALRSCRSKLIYMYVFGSVPHLIRHFFKLWAVCTAPGTAKLKPLLRGARERYRLYNTERIGVSNALMETSASSRAECITAPSTQHGFHYPGE